jgi:hypothetical protein
MHKDAFLLSGQECSCMLVTPCCSCCFTYNSTPFAQPAAAAARCMDASMATVSSHNCNADCS